MTCALSTSILMFGLNETLGRRWRVRSLKRFGACKCSQHIPLGSFFRFSRFLSLARNKNCWWETDESSVNSVQMRKISRDFLLRVYRKVCLSNKKKCQEKKTHQNKLVTLNKINRRKCKTGKEHRNTQRSTCTRCENRARPDWLHSSIWIPGNYPRRTSVVG